MSKNPAMSFPLRPSLLLGAVLATTLLAACAGGGGPAWTFAPLGPTPPPAASPTPGDSPAPGESPGDTLTLNVHTPEGERLIFEPDRLEAAAGTEVTVVYLNDSALPHNIHFFDSADRSGDTLGQTEIVTGPGAEQEVSFTTPAESGEYFFVCDVHPDMTGTLVIGEGE